MADLANPPTCSVDLRVRYVEVDAMGYLHHSRFLQYFEIARTEILRQFGVSYADLEKSGSFFVVIEASVRFRKPARYDDLVTVKATVSKQTPTRIYHDYEMTRDGVLLATGQTCIVCTDDTGSPQKVPEFLEPKD